MQRTAIVAFLLISLLLAGCDTADPTPTATPAGGGGPLPTLTAESLPASPTPDNYPAPPSPTATPEAYGVPQVPPTVDPYPVGDTVPTAILIYRPVGMQCQDPETYDYPTLADAVDSLEEAGVKIYDAMETERLACDACDVCPTSAHFEAIVDPAGLEAAQALGWLPQE